MQTVENITKGDECMIRKSFGRWSSNTRVTVVSDVERGEVVVFHEPTKSQFNIPVDLLVKKRKRFGS